MNLSIFDCKRLQDFSDTDTVIEEGRNQPDIIFKPILDKIKNMIRYTYIPREINPEAFTKLETSEIQALMGETLHEILEKLVTQDQIKEINTKLNHFINDLGTNLGKYSYRTPTYRQQALRKNDIYNLIIEAFFNIRKLHKKEGSQWLEIGQLSSGEKQKAIIHIVQKLLLRHKEKGSNLIIGIDEPESSLHISACFDQFNYLYKISEACTQVIFSSHWYGFFPTIEKGSVTVISKKQDSHNFDTINLVNYREQIKQKITNRNNKGKLPHDMRLKSINDFVQSVIISSTGEKPFNWLICEGSSEKIYFEKYFQDLLVEERLRIVPVGGASEIKRIYNYLSTAYEEFKTEITGNIVLLMDTDPQLVKFETNRTNNSDHLYCKRIVNCESEKKTKLVNIESNPVSPKTEIEHALNGELYLDTLKSFIDTENHPLKFLELVTATNSNDSYFSLDLKNSQWEILNSFLDNNNNKYNIAQKYVSKLTGNHHIPEWINTVRSWLT